LNVWGLPEPLADHVSERMRAIGARLAEFDLDVVALQEVWTPGVRDALLAAGRRAGLDHGWHNDVGLGGSGLMVLSRLPIEAARFEPFAVRGVPRHADYYGGKGFAALRLRGPDGPITLVDTHLHARHARSVDHQFVPHRVGQIVQIALAVLQIPDPVLAAGDFNSAEGEPEHLVLEGLTGLRDVAAELDRRQPTVLRANPYRTRSTKPDRRIDFLFARDGASLRATPARVERVFDGVFEHDGASLSCSNHAGVLAEIEIEPARRATPPGADPDAVVRAARWLAEGRALAESRRRGDRLRAGAGVGAALLASAGVRTRPMTRRRLLRGTLQAAGLLALTPTLGFSFLSEVAAPDEIEAFQILSERLAALR
jgi:endonuclease/exonuclease/phosphatase family metal-dependent hydrolase